MMQNRPSREPRIQPQKRLTHRQRAQDWVREGLPEGVRLTDRELLVLYEFTFWVVKTSFRITPHVHPSPVSKGVLAHCNDMNYNQYLKIVASLQKKKVLVKVRQGAGSKRKGGGRPTEWELPVERHLKTEFQETFDFNDKSMLSEHGLSDKSMLSEHGLSDKSMLSEHGLSTNHHVKPTKGPEPTRPGPLSSSPAPEDDGEEVNFSVYLLEALPKYLGFNAAVLAFCEADARSFAQTHGEPPDERDAVYIAERLERFIKESGVDARYEPYRVDNMLKSLCNEVLANSLSLRHRPPPDPEPEPERPRQSTGTGVTREQWEIVHQYHLLDGSPRIHNRTQMPSQIWDGALGELQLQVARPAFETWLTGTQGLGIAGEDDAFIIGTQNQFVSEMLETRMLPLIKSALRHVLGVDDIAVGFEVVPTPIPMDRCPFCRVHHAMLAAKNSQNRARKPTRY